MIKMTLKRSYKKPELIKHGDIKTITKGQFDGGSDAVTGDDIPAPSG